jgi:hypothetical protein
MPPLQRLQTTNDNVHHLCQKILLVGPFVANNPALGQLFSTAHFGPVRERLEMPLLVADLRHG